MDQPAIRKIIGQYREPVERAEVRIAGVDDLDSRMQHRSRDDLGTIVNRGAGRKIAAEPEGNLGLDADEPELPGVVSCRARANHFHPDRGAERGAICGRRTDLPPADRLSELADHRFLDLIGVGVRLRPTARRHFVNRRPAARRAKQAGGFFAVLFEHLTVLGFDLPRPMLRRRYEIGQH